MPRTLDQYKPAELVDIAKDEAKKLQIDKVKTNQIRNFYSEINRMKLLFQSNKENRLGEIESILVMLKPKLAYAAGRQAKIRRSFYPFMEEKIQQVIDANEIVKEIALKNFLLLMESIVGYHKFFGDK